MRFEIFCIGKAASFGVAFFLFWVGQSAFGSEKASFTEQVKKSKAIFLSGNRMTAIEGLKKLSKFGSNTRSQQQSLLKISQQMSKMFYKDVVQKEYEKGEKFLFKENQRAESHYRAGLLEEPNNGQLVLGQVRALILLGKCSRALKIANEFKWLEWPLPEIRLLKVSSLLCLGQKTKAGSLAVQLKKDPAYSESIVVDSFIIGSEFPDVKPAHLKRFKRLLNEMTPIYPPALYWAWRMKVSPSVRYLHYGEQYLSVCNNMSPGVRRTFKNSPQLCIKKEEVENLISKESTEYKNEG